MICSSTECIKSSLSAQKASITTAIFVDSMVAAAAAAEELDRQIKTDDKTASGKVYDEAADGQHTRTEDDDKEEEGVRMSMLQHTN